MTDPRLDARYLDRIWILLEYIGQSVVESRHRFDFHKCTAWRLGNTSLEGRGSE